MTIETAQYITQLNPNQPTAKSGVGEDDDHLRLIRNVLKSSFPQFDNPIMLTHEQINDIPQTWSDLVKQKATLSAAKTAEINIANAKKTAVLAFDWDDLELEQDLPSNEIYALFYDAGGANRLTAEWIKCDGHNGTEDLTSMAIELVGSSAQEAIPIYYYSGLHVIKYIGS